MARGSSDGIEVRTPEEGQFENLARVDGVAFGSPWTPERLARERSVIDLDRFRVAVEGSSMVGVAGSFALEMTLPGGAAIPTGGVTWVGVLPTHRRRGILRRLLAAVHDDIDARREPLAALYASEGSIYGRFGYGVASHQRRVVVDRRRASFRVGPPPRTVRLVTEGDPVPELTGRWERARRLRPGEIARSETWHRKVVDDRVPAAVYALHDDGYAAWTIEPRWGDDGPHHQLDLHELVAATSEAHLALWHTVLAIDLVEEVTTKAMPLDDPLPLLLDDARTVRTRDVTDGLWLAVRDVPACFDARSYGTDGDVVVEVHGTRWRIGTSGCRRVRSRPDLETDGAGLSALLLGGVRPSDLAAGRRLTARSAEALRRADALFAVAPLPHSQTSF